MRSCKPLRFRFMKHWSGVISSRHAWLATPLLFASILGLVSFPADAELGLSDEFIVADGAVDQFLTAVAYNPYGREYLVVWREASTPYQGGISAARVSWDGRVLSSFVVSAGTAGGDHSPSVAFDTIYGRYLVVWSRETSSVDEIFGRFIPAGGPDAGLPEFKISDSNDEVSPVVAFNPLAQEFLVAWETRPGEFTPGYISGRRVRASDLGFVGIPFILVSGLATRLQPDLTYNLARNQYLLAYDLRPPGGDFFDRDVYAQRLAANASPVGAEFDISSGPGGQAQPSVATCTGNDQYVVAWMAYTFDIFSVLTSAISVQVINGDGSFEPGTVLIADINDILEVPSVACHELTGEHLVVWMTSNPMQVRTIEGTRLGGAISSSPPAAITETPGSVGWQSVAAGIHGFLVVWGQENPGSGYLDVLGRVVWHVFADGFESGNTSTWSATVP